MASVRRRGKKFMGLYRDAEGHQRRTMNEFNEPEVPVSAYGAARKADWMARLQANSEMMNQAAMQVHRQSEDRRVVQAGQAGLFGHATPQEMGATVAARPATIGGAWGQGRPLERLRGTNWESQGAGAVGPIPGGAYIQLNRPAHQFGASPLLTFMQGREQ